MASLVGEIKDFKMSGVANNPSRDGDRRKTVLLEVAYGLYSRRVYTLCLRLLASVRDAEEATVRVFARLKGELSRRWDEAHVLSRLVELAVDEALRLLRARAPGSLGGQAAEGGNPPTANFEGQVDGRTVAASTTAVKFDLTKLDSLAARLPDELRVAFVLRDREGLSDLAVAAHLRVRETEARRLIHRARMELRRMLSLARAEEG